MAEHKFPTEVIDLPSLGKVYPKDSPLADGKIELKYMTTKEEDILMSQNLIKKGVVIDKLLDSLIVTEGIKQDDLILGDKNAVLVAARILLMVLNIHVVLQIQRILNKQLNIHLIYHNVHLKKLWKVWITVIILLITQLLLVRQN